MRAVGNYTFEGAKAATRTLLSSRTRPDAIFCANDHMALAAMETARAEFGLTVGKDISIVGFDDVDLAAWPSFSLTTFSQPIEAMAASVTTILEALMRGEGPASAQEIVPGRLLVRGSADGLAALKPGRRRFPH
jgi:DNA-binding LacI/PurR family transcriptional regulator